VIWTSPVALIGLIAIAAPILIHFLVQRRAAPFPFPTLRFLRPARLAAIRRHVLDDVALLAVRAAVAGAAAVALAGPLMLTPARRAEWNARLVRALVVDDASRSMSGSTLALRASLSGRESVVRTETFATGDLRDGIARAVAWLDAAPPARRELVIASPFTLDSISRRDLADVPADVGIRLERSGELAATRSLAGTPVLRADGRSATPRRRDRTIELIGPATSVRESGEVPATVPLEIIATGEAKHAAETVLAAVLSQGVFAPAPGRHAKVIFASPPAARPAPPVPWIADAIAELMSGETAQWSAASSDGTQLVVTNSAPARDIRTAMLFRSILNALAPERDAVPEVLTIPDADLRAWERPRGDVRSPRVETIDENDRRWWWAAVLALLTLETVMRRTRKATRSPQEVSRVA